MKLAQPFFCRGADNYSVDISNYYAPAHQSAEVFRNFLGIFFQQDRSLLRSFQINNKKTKGLKTISSRQPFIKEQLLL